MENLLENLLPATILLPLAGAIWLWFIADKGKKVVRQSALLTTLFTFGLAGYIVFHYTPEGSPLTSWTANWLGEASGADIQFNLGLDGLSVWLFGLSAMLMITAVLISWDAIDDRPAAFYGLLLLLETGMLGVFAARDIILFYVFFEFTLIPLFFLIGIWGSEDRRYASIKFFLFTLAGSLLTFLGLLTIVLWNFNHSEGAMTFSIPALVNGLAAHPLDTRLQLVVFLALFAGFAIKVPLFPLHTWLPLAHVQAPTAGSVILAGILLKIGTYGFLRFSIPMLPDATAMCVPWLLGLSTAGIIYGALVALAQTDIKKLIAYSSVSHLGYCMLGLFALNHAGIEGSVLQMINHGLSTGGLFAIVGMIYERYHTREIKALGGLCRRLPIITFFMVLFTFSSIGLPGLNGFAGEFLILQGMFQRAFTGAPAQWAFEFKAFAVLAVFGVVLGAWYMLWLVERVFFGPLKEPAHDAHGHDDHGASAKSHAKKKDHGHAHGHGDHDHGGHGTAAPPPFNGIHDMRPREVFALAPLVVFMFWIGLHPQFFLDRMTPTLDPITAAADKAFNESVGLKVAGTTESHAQPAAALVQK